MPEMTGEKLAQEIRKIRSDVAIITMGSGEFIDLNKDKKIGIKGNLLKPLIKSELNSTVRKVLDGD